MEEGKKGRGGRVGRMGERKEEVEVRRREESKRKEGRISRRRSE